MNGLTRRLRLDHQVMLAPIFAQLRRGPGDPTHRRVGDMFLRATRTPAGPSFDQDHRARHRRRCSSVGPRG